MTDSRHKDFSADGTHNDGAAKDSLMLMATGTFGGGTLNVKRYSDSRGAFVTVAAISAAMTDAQEIRVGKDSALQFQLTGATTPSVALDYWFV